MPFIPHTNEEVSAMLEEIRIADMEALFDEIPNDLRSEALDRVPDGMSEMAMLRWMAERAAQDEGLVCFAGAGSYDHHIPSAVWDLATRGEFMTAYTPYQAEASQGTLQVIFEYQSMMSELTALEVSNASVYDGASGLAEAVLMGVRGNRRAKSTRVLVAETVHPHYLDTVRNIVTNQGIQVETLAMGNGAIDPAGLADDAPVAAVVVQQPNFFGLLEQVDEITDWAHDQGALVVALVNPVTLAVLKPPGRWGTSGADIACGDGQPLGVPMASGGPSFGFLCCNKELVRQLPGRLVGRTLDLDGKVGYTLTLQAREQHIRRGKATSNICTNQGLLVTVATIHMALLGARGLAQVARASAHNTRRLVERLTRIKGVRARFDAPFFHECALELPAPADGVLDALATRGVLGGVALGGYFPDMAETLLVCATEKRTNADCKAYAQALEEALA